MTKQHHISTSSGTMLWIKWAIALVMLASIFNPTRVLAVDGPDDDKYNISFGGFFVTNTNGRIQVDQKVTNVLNIGTSIDWKRDLGGETSMTIPRFDGFYRFAPNHRMDFSWYNVKRTGDIVTKRDFYFGGTFYPAGSVISSLFGSETLKLAYTYSFYRAPEIETGLSAGFHVTKFRSSLQTNDGSISASESATAPLPVVGFRLDYHLSPKWLVRSKYELFFIDRFDQFQGSLNDVTIAIEHNTFEHIGFGFGLNRSAITGKIYDGDTAGSFDSTLNGFMLYLVAH